MLQLTITKVENMWLYTDVFTDGVITDPCDGDSGGPLAILRDGRWQLVGVLKGEGYDCGRDSFNGDGLWSNVAGQREWVESQMLDGLTLGELRLQGGTGEVSGDLAKGNVFLDGHPVCDAGWSQEDARVACRMLGYGIGIPETGSTYGLAQPDDVFKLTHVTCSGTELTLLDCLSRPSRGCLPGNVAGVTCFRGWY